MGGASLKNSREMSGLSLDQNSEIAGRGTAARFLAAWFLLTALKPFIWPDGIAQTQEAGPLRWSSGHQRLWTSTEN